MAFTSRIGPMTVLRERSIADSGAKITRSLFQAAIVTAIAEAAGNGVADGILQKRYSVNEFDDILVLASNHVSRKYADKLGLWDLRNLVPYEKAYSVSCLDKCLRLQEKAYQMMVNARTGEVQGSRPWSWLKILLFTLFCLGAVTGIVFLFLYFFKKLESLLFQYNFPFQSIVCFFKQNFCFSVISDTMVSRFCFLFEFN